ncbi:MAG: hypothetical protein UEY91_01215 [Lachnospiraceae bacterium]|nr:hypothetical protein [Pseudobutyrivibrio sp.]MEE0105389.1 hypothetical protein [Lachnospiraceae bacterium]
MKYKKRVLCGVMLCFCLLLTGCGKLYVMTEEEEDQVVLYAAKMISKYNRAQDTGYSYVSKENKDKQQDTDTDVDADEQNTQQSEPQMTLSDAIGISGISFSYQGYDISTSYETTDVAIPDAGEGYSYLILHIQVTNTTEQGMLVDLINQPITYKITINDETTVDGLTTLSMADLSTYYNKSLDAQETVDTDLLFQVSTADLENISSLALQVSKDGQTNTINLQ